MIKINEPPKEVLDAFGLKNAPTKLTGGQGNSYLADGVVLKPVENITEANWTAELFSTIKEDGFRVEKPIKTVSGEWVFDNWCAFSYLDGKEVKGRYTEKIEISEKFHWSLKGVTEPSFIKASDHPWAIADKMVWGEIPLTYGERLEVAISPLMTQLKNINLENQIIHGDLTGNILFSDTLSPGIIDMSPYFRPKEYASAIIIVDSIVWDGAPDNTINAIPNDFNSNQLLLRATMWRIKTTEEFIKKYNQGNINDVDKYHHLTDLITTRITNQHL